MHKIRRHTYLTCCTATMFLLFTTGAVAQDEDIVAQDEDSAPVHRPLFDEDSMLLVTVEGPLQTLNRVRSEDEEYPALFKYVNADGSETVLDINLRVRGKFRAKKETCNFAPLRINFKKKQVEDTIYAGQDKIKLVTDCQSSKSAYQQILLKEYLAYKLLNVLSDRSFGARLLWVTYIDTDRKNRSRDSYAFFIEEKEHIGERIGYELIETPRLKYALLDPAQSNLVNVYEYFIANTDFSLVAGPKDSNCCHNTVPFQKDGGPYVSIPYDFDHAGMINAPYASPNPKFKIKNVKTRVYRGRCSNNELLDATFKQFNDKRDEIYGAINGLEGFDERSVKGTTSFIDDFYEDITSPKDVERRFIKKCS